MSSSRSARIVTPWSFAAALKAAGIIHEPERIAEIVIRCKPDEVVMIEVSYFADERLYGLTNPAAGSTVAAEAARDDGVPRCVHCGIEGDENILWPWQHDRRVDLICRETIPCAERKAAREAA